jgi:Transposase
MSVIIGVDPHKATHTAVAIDRSEAELARARVRATRKQVPQLLRWAERLGERTWAVESAGGLGYLLSQQLIAAGETVLASIHRFSVDVGSLVGGALVDVERGLRFGDRGSWAARFLRSGRWWVVGAGFVCGAPGRAGGCSARRGLQCA